MRLFVAQRNHRLDAHGAACGNVRRRQCHERQQNSHTGKGERIGGAHREKQVREETRQSQPCRNAECEAEQHQLKENTRLQTCAPLG